MLCKQYHSTRKIVVVFKESTIFLLLPSQNKCSFTLFISNVWPFVLFEIFLRLIFLLLLDDKTWIVLYVWLTFFNFLINFLNKTDGQILDTDFHAALILDGVSRLEALNNLMDWPKRTGVHVYSAALWSVIHSMSGHNLQWRTVIFREYESCLSGPHLPFYNLDSVT